MALEYVRARPDPAAAPGAAMREESGAPFSGEVVRTIFAQVLARARRGARCVGKSCRDRDKRRTRDAGAGAMGTRTS